MKSVKSLLNKNIGLVFIAALFIWAMLAPSKYTQEIFFQLFIWAGLGCAWNLNCGYCKRNSIGHAVFFGFGAYSTALIYTKTPLSPWIGMIVGAALCAVVAFGIGRATLRLRGTFFTLTTIAFAEVIRILSISLKGVTNGSQGIVIKYVPGLMNMTFTSKKAYIVLAFIYMLVVLFACIRLEHSKFGYQLIAIGEDTQAAEVLGVNSAKV
ncbi:MAG: branched-chain amino acid ABC transporter permease, partial [Eubacteriales bacterium]|nr:branched-chain amino acid ABC transporter permease [Eubacteriales bacterium]